MVCAQKECVAAEKRSSQRQHNTMQHHRRMQPRKTKPTRALSCAVVRPYRLRCQRPCCSSTQHFIIIDDLALWRCAQCGTSALKTRSLVIQALQARAGSSTPRHAWPCLSAPVEIIWKSERRTNEGNAGRTHGSGSRAYRLVPALESSISLARVARGQLSDQHLSNSSE